MTPEEIDDQAKDNPTAEDATPSGIDPDEWISLREALRGTGTREPIPIVQVVTAIENEKCFFRDRYGRIEKMTGDQIEMVRAALEQFDEYEHYPDLYGRPSPIYHDAIIEELVDFGWPIGELEAFQSWLADPERPLKESERQKLYRTIYTLAEILVGTEKYDECQEGGRLVVSKLSKVCSEFHASEGEKPPTGYSESTFRDALRDAINAIARGSAEPHPVNRWGATRTK